MTQCVLSTLNVAPWAGMNFALRRSQSAAVDAVTPLQVNVSSHMKVLIVMIWNAVIWYVLLTVTAAKSNGTILAHPKR